MFSHSIVPCFRSLSRSGASALTLRSQSWGTRNVRQVCPEKRLKQHRCVSQRGEQTLSMSDTPVRDTIQQKVTTSLKPVSLDIQDESSKHAGHAAMKGLPAGETHFKLSIVSPEFEGLTTIKRHKMVYQVLAEELAGPIHALSLKTKAPSEA